MRNNLCTVSKQFFFRWFLLFSTFIIATSSYTQVTNDWNRFIDDETEGSSMVSKAITKDAAGNVYVTGYGINLSATSEPDAIVAAIFTAKYNPSGLRVWFVYHYTTSNNVRLIPTAIAVSSEGFVYVAGYRTTSASSYQRPEQDILLKYDVSNSSNDAVGVSTADFAPTDLALDPDGNVYVTGTRWFESPTYHSVMYTKKLDADLNFQWSMIVNTSTFNSSANALAVDGANVYVTGTSAGGGNSGSVINTVKYDASSGQAMNIAQYSGSAHFHDEGLDIALDAASNVYVTGFSTDGIPGSSGTYNRLYTTIKYNTNLGQQWINTYDGTFSTPHDVGRALVVDAGGNICVTGTGGNILPGVTVSDIVTIKYSSSGSQQWVKVYEGPAQPSDIDTDGFGNVYVTGSGVDDGSDIITLKYNPAGIEQWRIVYTSADNPSNDLANAMVVDDNANVYVTGRANAAAITVKYIQCNLSCPENISVNNTPAECGAIVNYPSATATSTCGTPTYSIASGTFFPVGTTTVTVLSETGESNCTFTVTVIDNENPVITVCPSPVTVTCAADVLSANISLITATDNCGTPTITHVGDVVSNQLCTNKFTITRTYKATDASGNTTTCSQTITVNDNTAPQITGLTVSQQVLAPPNHKMRDITVNYNFNDNCVSTPNVTISVSSNEPVNGTGDGDTAPDWEIIDNHHVKLRAERSANGDGRIYTITVTVDDGCNPPVSQSKQVMVAHNITGPQSGKPFKVGSIVNFSGVFQDKPGKTHTGKWLLDGNVAANGTVIEPAGNLNGKVTGSYKFNSPGVYKLQMNVIDQTGAISYANTNGDVDAIVVIFDPNGGNTYGGGYYNSPAGALKSNPTATGKASYGFAMNYFKNSTNPKGETQFDFKVGSFEFNALNFEYLVINNSMSQFKGTGKITGGQSGVAFTMTVVDGQLDGSGVDKVRMKIYNKNNGSIIYDNQPGASDAALPTQAVGANSTIVISGTNSSLTQSNTTQKSEMEATAPEVSSELDVIAYPNPSASNFSISVKANPVKEKITMQVIDMYGRIIETRNVNANSPIRFGDRYNAGTYFVRVIQGKQHKEIKLIKVPD